MPCPHVVQPVSSGHSHRASSQTSREFAKFRENQHAEIARCRAIKDLAGGSMCFSKNAIFSAAAILMRRHFFGRRHGRPTREAREPREESSRMPMAPASKVDPREQTFFQ